MSSITFETATFADVVKKAAKIAPSKGAAFDKAAGIVIEFNPTMSVPLAVVRATNLDLFMMEWVSVAEWSGEGQRWRLPSALLALVVGSLPIGTGKTVTLESIQSGHNWYIELRSGRTKVKFFPIDASYYPDWGAFDPDEMFPASNFGGRVSQVAWAAGKGDPRLAGVYLDGEYAVSTDTFRLARVPLSIPDLEKPIIVPAEVLGSILKETGDIQIGKSNEDNTLRIMPDDTTQIKAVIYDVDFPPVQKVIDVELPERIKFNRDILVEAMQRMSAFSVGERIATLRTFIGKEEIAFYLENEQVGSIGDVVELPGQCEHDRLEIIFTPRNIIEAVSKAPNTSLELCYNLEKPRYPVKIDDDAGYEAWVMPRSKTEVKS